jgi:hypothetical protein
MTEIGRGRVKTLGFEISAQEFFTAASESRQKRTLGLQACYLREYHCVGNMPHRVLTQSGPVADLRNVRSCVIVST